MAESSTGLARQVRVGVLELVHLELEQRLGLEDPAEGREPLREQAPQVFLIPADDLEHEVDAAGARAQVLDLRQLLERLDHACARLRAHAQEDDGEDRVAEAVRVGHGDDVEDALAPQAVCPEADGRLRHAERLRDRPERAAPVFHELGHDRAVELVEVAGVVGVFLADFASVARKPAGAYPPTAGQAAGRNPGRDGQWNLGVAPAGDARPVYRPATFAGFWPAMRRRHASSSVAPMLASMGAPCVLAWLAPRDPESRQRHRTNH